MIANLASTGWSETIDVTTLNDYEKQVHRAVWCRMFEDFRYDNWVSGKKTFENFDFESDRTKHYETNNFYELLKGNNFFHKDWNDRQIKQKLEADMEKQLIFGEISFSLSDIDDCHADMKALLKKEYIHNFSYLEK